MGWRAGSGGRQGLMAGRVGRWAGWLEGDSGMDLWSKECSGVNIVRRIYVEYSTTIKIFNFT